jgi:hypothetical protein
VRYRNSFWGLELMRARARGALSRLNPSAPDACSHNVTSARAPARHVLYWEYLGCQTRAPLLMECKSSLERRRIHESE